MVGNISLMVSACSKFITPTNSYLNMNIYPNKNKYLKTQQSNTDILIQPKVYLIVQPDKTYDNKDKYI